MILQELNRFYDKLLANPDIEICEPGFSKENISFKIIINEDGSLFAPDNPIEDLRESDGKNVRPVKITVPKLDGKRASGIKPYFLWDKTDYVIGIKKDKDNKDDIIEIETPKHHEAFLKMIDTVLKESDLFHPAVLAIHKFCSFEENIKYLRHSEYWGDFLNSFVIFEVKGFQKSNVFEIEEINTIWKKYYSSLSSGSNSHSGICLVSGEYKSLAPLHPTIKKGIGGKNDIPLISCNINVAESYLKKKNANMPISSEAASALSGALNYLIDERRHNMTIADTKTLFWAESNDTFADYFGQIFDRKPDDGYSPSVESFLNSMRLGRLPDEIDDESRFFVLGLAPNAARVSIRFWYVNSVASVAKNISKHFADLQLIKQNKEKDFDFPSVWQLVIETATQHKTENIPHNLSGPLMHSILSASVYPVNVLSILIGRMRIDQEYRKLNYYRAAFIKAILNRNYKKELTMALDHERTTVPYLLGRLFSVLEKVQEESAGGSLNATIKDRYFASASTIPQVVFPRLISLHQNHIKKLKADKAGLAVTREKLMGEIISHLPPAFPATLKLEDQGEFAIGYYHQRQDFFTKKELKEETIN